MSNASEYSWVKFYEELATTLVDYKDNREVLVQKVKNVYLSINMKMPMLDKDNLVVDIDPFTVFGLFNKNMKDENRIRILEGFAKEFNLNSPVPDNFDGVPLLMPLNATFYYFADKRGDDDIDNLWNLFIAALQYAKNKSSENQENFAKSFDILSKQKGVGVRMTMGLYWICPQEYLNLDSRNWWYIYYSGKLPSEFVATPPSFKYIPTSAEYFEVMASLQAYFESPECEFDNYMDLSSEAFRHSEEVNQKNKAEKALIKNEAKGLAVADEDVDTIHYWIYSPGDGAEKWDEYYDAGIMAIGWGAIGDLNAFTSKDEMIQMMKEKIDPTSAYKYSAHATWQFANEMKPGDVVFAKKGMHVVLGRGIVSSDYRYDITQKDGYNNVRSMDWTDKGEWTHPGQAVMKTLTDITAYTEYVEKLNALFDNDIMDDTDNGGVIYPAYSVEKFLQEVYMDEDSYETLVALIKNKKNVILQGAPGVGKTYAAKRLAYSMMGIKDIERVVMVQFHQSYSYEDLIMGFRPTETNFALKRGSFYNLCKKAEVDSENEYFFIIDEINRGNLSKIFGELFMLIESDKRGVELQLLYSEEKFSVPENVYIIGMMNTADRSLAMLDYALRRRFAFFPLKPGFESEGFREYSKGLANQKFDKLINCVGNLNAAITADESLGEEFCIGHSFFCNFEEATGQRLSHVVEYELIPLLKEYWFDEPMKVKEWMNNLRSAIA